MLYYIVLTLAKSWDRICCTIKFMATEFSPPLGTIRSAKAIVGEMKTFENI